MDLEGHERVRVMFPDHLGLARGKYLPSDRALRGTGHSATLFGLGYDRSMISAPGSYLLEGMIDLEAKLDPATLRTGWEDDETAVAVAALTLRGEPFPFSARTVLQQAIAAWKDLGYTPYVGIELEAYLLQPDPNGGWERYENPRAMVYGTGPSNDPHGVIDEIMRSSRRCGFKLESVNAEFDESQYELTLEYNDALSAADDSFLFRVMAREIALRHGLDLTFLGKPFPILRGNGVHVNISFLDTQKRNAFVDTDREHGLSALAIGAIAGLCHHHRALTAIMAPTVNAYRRLQPAQLSGYWANWGLDHRCVANRIPPNRGSATRIENRIADGSVNIHLAVAAVLTAARLGVVNRVSCPPTETGDGFVDVNTSVCAAPNLGVGLDDLEADTVFSAALGEGLVENFVANKRSEWQRFTRAEGRFDGDDPITPWERHEYLMYH